MKNGDISNAVAPRLLLVFEGALGHIEEPDVPDFNALASHGKWTQAWDLWHINEGMAGMIWHVTRTQMIQVSVVTYIADSKEAGLGLTACLDSHGLPISQVMATTPARIAREIAYMHDVAAIYDANPESWAMYGRRGRALTNVNDFGRLLWITCT